MIPCIFFIGLKDRLGGEYFDGRNWGPALEFFKPIPGKRMYHGRLSQRWELICSLKLPWSSNTEERWARHFFGILVYEFFNDALSYRNATGVTWSVKERSNFREHFIRKLA